MFSLLHCPLNNLHIHTLLIIFNLNSFLIYKEFKLEELNILTFAALRLNVYEI